MSKRWTAKEIKLLTELKKQNKTYKEIGSILTRSWKAVSAKIRELGLNNKQKRKTHKEYVKELKIKCPTMEVLDNYINAKTNIRHKCLLCGVITLSMPTNKLKGKACRYCNKTGGTGLGINPMKPGILYLVYFYDYDLFKIGITGRDLRTRLLEINKNYEIILSLKFQRGQEAIYLETKWLENIKDYKINTGKLKSGNTETFRI